MAIVLQQGAVIAVSLAVAAANSRRWQALAIGLADALWAPILHLTGLVLAARDALASF